MSAQWYYAIEGVSHGPVDVQALEALVQGGTIRADTLVWQEGMDDWLPYGRAGVAEAATPPLQDSHTDMQRNTPDPARADANTFLGALKDGFARYVDFKTRSTRSQFWWFALWSVIFGISAAVMDGMIGFGGEGPVSLLSTVALLLPMLAVTIRRLHDIGRTGWWVLIQFVPLIGFIVLIVFACTKSDPHANRWGVPPRR